MKIRRDQLTEREIKYLMYRLTESDVVAPSHVDDEIRSFLTDIKSYLDVNILRKYNQAKRYANT